MCGRWRRIVSPAETVVFAPLSCASADQGVRRDRTPGAKLRPDDPQSLRHIENAFPTNRKTLLEFKDLLGRAVAL